MCKAQGEVKGTDCDLAGKLLAESIHREMYLLLSSYFFVKTGSFIVSVRQVVSL
jgi:hypothetical protein